MSRAPFMIVLFLTVLLPADASPKLKVFVTDHTGTPPLALIRAQQRAAQVIKLAGIDSAWKLCPPQSELPGNPPCYESGKLSVWIRILPTEKAKVWSVEQQSCGVALTGETGEHGFLAIVDAGCITRISRSREAWVTALGHVIAHEIGHLLLGHNSHGTSGLMSANWTEAEQVMLTGGRLRFHSEDSHRMRDAVLARTESATEREVAGRSK